MGDILQKYSGLIPRRAAQIVPKNNGRGIEGGYLWLTVMQQQYGLGTATIQPRGAQNPRRLFPVVGCMSAVHLLR